MSTQTLTWIALPNGVANGKLKLSVLVTPQLVPDAGAHPTLGSPGAGFPDLRDWPAAVKNIKFDVTFGSAAPVTGIKPTSAAPRSDLWRALFSANTPVAPYKFTDRSNLLIRSYPVPTVRDALKMAHVATATGSPSSPPSVEDLGFTRYYYNSIIPHSGYSLVRGVDTDQKFEIDQLIRFRDGGVDSHYHALGVADLDVHPGWAFAQAELFHVRPDQRADTHLIFPKRPEDALPPAPSLDFHTTLTSLGDYPALMRMFGLVFDLIVPIPAATGDTTVSVVPSPGSFTPAAGPTAKTSSPKTSCTVNASTFAAGPAGTGVVPGYVSLRDGYEVIEFDVDGHALKSFRFNTAVQHGNENGLSSNPDDLSSMTLFPPAPRGAGLAVAHVDRAVQLSRTLQRHKQLDQRRTAGQDLTFDRADLTKGYVVDVWNDHDNTWHTLCARVGTYYFPTTKKTLKITDEASTRLAGTMAAADDPDNFYLHEVVFRWDGWSLAAPRPGKSIMRDAHGVQAAGTPSSPAGADFPLEVTFTPAPGSLPRLRYGTSYRFRVRAVDLAGNAVPFSADSTDFAGTGATDPIRYTRFDPVAVPFVLPRKPKTAGESPERLVIRSNYNAAATADCQRHIAPAKVAELMAEEHGLWDAANGKPKSTDYKLIATHESAGFDDSGVPDPNGGGTRYYDTDNPGVPYIPDPITRGATLQDIPGQSALLKVPFAAPKSTGSAPHSPFDNGYSFRLVVVEGTGAPTFDPKKRVLTVRLPKATFAKVKLSSYVDAADLPLLGMWSWFTESLSAGDLATQRQLIANGQQFAVTPYRELTLVHAVRQPLVAPSFTGLTAVRTDVGQTDVAFTGTVNFDRASTQKVDIVGSWDEYVDIPSTAPGAQRTDSAPAITPSRARAFELLTRLSDPDGDHESLADDSGRRLRHVFGDTKHRMVNYSAVATTRFQDYFVQTVRLTLSTGSPVTVNAAGIVEQSDVLRNVSADPKADSTITYTRGVDYDVDYAAGTITARTPLGSQAVHVAYVAPPVTRSSTERPLPAPIDVLSTARPAAPRVLYVVPTFGWSHSTTTTGQSSGRSGNGLRVYLDRPWWSTGQDEQLAVIALPAGAASPPPDNLAPLVTLWGRDPIWKTGSLAAAPKAADFPSAATVAHDVHLAEIGETVDVAAHDVAYDSQRGVWFADVTVDTGAASYSPFIRLALARYQAHSLPNYNIELSSVVLAEFTKLSPDRTASVAYAGNPTTVNVSVNGLANTGGAFGDDTTLVTVVVETALDGVQGELGWVASTLPAVQLVASPGPNGTTTWAGPVTLPTSRGHGPMRLVIREYELYATDPDSPTIDATAGRRLVYVDTIEI